MDYVEIVRSSFWTAWRNRYLWFFGFFAAGAGSGFGNFNVPIDGGSGGESGGGSDLVEELASNVGLIVAIVAAFLLILLVFVALSVISHGGLTQSVAAIQRGGTRSFGATWRAGLATFWRVFLLSLLLLAIVLGFYIAVGVPVGLVIWGTIAATDSTVARVVVIALVALLAIAALIVFLFAFWVVSQLATRELVLGGRRVMEALRSGYRLFRRKLGPCVLLGLIGVAFAIAIGIAFALIALLVGVLFALPAIGLAVAGNVTGAIIAGVVAALIVLPAFFVVAGAVGTYKHAFWTIGWLRLRAVTEWEDDQGMSPAVG